MLQAEAPRAELAGWGGGPAAEASLIRPDRAEEVREALGLARTGAIARGMGRSYGDAAQLRDGFVIDTTALKGISLDASSGVLTAGAGATIGELMARLVPDGWMVPVVPGTQHVTVGGAIASDIHGKNHGVAGTFGSHVEQIELLTSDGQVTDLSPGAPLFAATLGGMGLTGVICSARIRLRPIGGPLLAVDTDRVESLEEALAALRAPVARIRSITISSTRSAPGGTTS